MTSLPRRQTGPEALEVECLNAGRWTLDVEQLQPNQRCEAFNLWLASRILGSDQSALRERLTEKREKYNNNYACQCWPGHVPWRSYRNWARLQEPKTIKALVCICVCRSMPWLARCCSISFEFMPCHWHGRVQTYLSFRWVVILTLVLAFNKISNP